MTLRNPPNVAPAGNTQLQPLASSSGTYTPRLRPMSWGSLKLPNNLPVTTRLLIGKGNLTPRSADRLHTTGCGRQNASGEDLRLVWGITTRIHAQPRETRGSQINYYTGFLISSQRHFAHEDCERQQRKQNRAAIPNPERYSTVTYAPETESAVISGHEGASNRLP